MTARIFFGSVNGASAVEIVCKSNSKSITGTTYTLFTDDCTSAKILADRIKEHVRLRMQPLHTSALDLMHGDSSPEVPSLNTPCFSSDSYDQNADCMGSNASRLFSASAKTYRAVDRRGLAASLGPNARGMIAEAHRKTAERVGIWFRPIQNKSNDGARDADRIGQLRPLPPPPRPRKRRGYGAHKTRNQIVAEENSNTSNRHSGRMEAKTRRRTTFGSWKEIGEQMFWRLDGEALTGRSLDTGLTKRYPFKTMRQVFLKGTRIVIVFKEPGVQAVFLEASSRKFAEGWHKSLTASLSMLLEETLEDTQCSGVVVATWSCVAASDASTSSLANPDEQKAALLSHSNPNVPEPEQEQVSVVKSSGPEQTICLVLQGSSLQGYHTPDKLIQEFQVELSAATTVKELGASADMSDSTISLDGVSWSGSGFELFIPILGDAASCNETEDVAEGFTLRCYVEDALVGTWTRSLRDAVSGLVNETVEVNKVDDFPLSKPDLVASSLNRRLMHIFKELIQTELTYVSRMNILCDTFVSPIVAAYQATVPEIQPFLSCQVRGLLVLNLHFLADLVFAGHRAMIESNFSITADFSVLFLNVLLEVSQIGDKMAQYLVHNGAVVMLFKAMNRHNEPPRRESVHELCQRVYSELRHRNDGVSQMCEDISQQLDQYNRQQAISRRVAVIKRRRDMGEGMCHNPDEDSSTKRYSSDDDEEETCFLAHGIDEMLLDEVASKNVNHLQKSSAVSVIKSAVAVVEDFKHHIKAYEPYFRCHRSLINKLDLLKETGKGAIKGRVGRDIRRRIDIFESDNKVSEKLCAVDVHVQSNMTHAFPTLTYNVVRCCWILFLLSRSSGFHVIVCS